ncbi:MAG: SH3 domain-containing C40 family peptidase [Bacilli bacterium]
MTMKGLIFVLILAIYFSISPHQSHAAYSYTEPIIEIKQTVSFRERASTSGERIRYLKSGEKLEIISRPNSYWYEAQDIYGTIGFLSSSSTYIKLSTNLIYPEPNGEVVRSVSFRTGPSTSSNRIRYLARGEMIWILEKVNNYWFKAGDKNNTVGYVSTNAKYIHTAFNDSTVDARQPNAQVIKSVSFRKGPSTSDERIRYLQAGEPLWIVTKLNNYWYEAQDKNGTIGYVSSSSSYITSSYIKEETIRDLNGAVELIINAGMTYLGTPYEYGSSRFDTRTFDCSDFIRQIFLDGIGLKLPSDSRQQADWVKQNAGGQAIADWQQLHRGDLMFFMSYKGYDTTAYTTVDKSMEEVTHVGMYLGNNQVLHTYSVQSGGVVISNVDGTHWENRFLYGGTALHQ